MSRQNKTVARTFNILSIANPGIQSELFAVRLTNVQDLFRISLNTQLKWLELVTALKREALQHSMMKHPSILSRDRATTPYVPSMDVPLLKVFLLI